MKLAILSESPADEAVLRVLVTGLLGEPLQLVAPALRARGWPSVEQVLPSVLRHLHFNTDARGLVVVVDSDDTPVHTAEHEAPGYHHPLCRMCRLRAVFRRTMKNLPPARGRMAPLRAIGLAVPAIEAWLLCGREDGVTEEEWMAGLARGQMPFTRRDLKARVYGTTRSTLPWQTERGLAEVQRHRGDFRRLENDFPNGFGALARDLRKWKATEEEK